MDSLFDRLSYGVFEGSLGFDSNVWTWLLIAAITIVVLFYGTRYVFTGVNVTTGGNDNIPYKRCNVGHRAAVVSMKGHRQYMEDTYQAVPSFGGRDNWSFYGVFDGHGGARCSVYVAHFLYKHVWSCIDLYLEHNSLNSEKLWKLLLNDENLVSYEINNNENDKTNNINRNKNNNNNNTNPNTNTNTKIRNDDKLNNNENERNKEDKILKTNENNENLINNSENNNNNENNSNNTNSNTEESLLTSDRIDELDDAVPLLNKNNSEFRPKHDGFKSSSLSTTTQRGSDASDTEFESNITKNKDKRSKRPKIVRKLIGIPKYVDEIMKEALIQSHRYADKEFLALANRQQWQDGSTAISCVILPAKDILHALMNEERNGVINSKNSDTSSVASSNDALKQRQKELYSIPSNNNNSEKYLKQSENSLNNKNNNNNKILSHIKNNLKIDDICDDKDTWMFISNTGDSRAILVTSSGQSIALSTDHKPNRMDERRRIEEKGGRVVFFGVWRVEGVLAVSRAFGDRRLKRWVVPDPEILSRKIEENDMFMILASDGVWDAVSNEQAARYAHQVWNDENYKNSDLKTKLQAIAAKISSMAFRLGSMDNITALVVHLPSHCTYGISGSLADLNRLNNE